MVVGVTFVTYASVSIQLHFLIGRLYLMSVWFGEDQRTNAIKSHLKLDCTTSSTFINMANTIEGTYPFKDSIDMHFR